MTSELIPEVFVSPLDEEDDPQLIYGLAFLGLTEELNSASTRCANDSALKDFVSLVPVKERQVVSIRYFGEEPEWEVIPPSRLEKNWRLMLKLMPGSVAVVRPTADVTQRVFTTMSSSWCDEADEKAKAWMEDYRQPAEGPVRKAIDDLANLLGVYEWANTLVKRRGTKLPSQVAEWVRNELTELLKRAPNKGQPVREVHPAVAARFAELEDVIHCMTAVIVGMRGPDPKGAPWGRARMKKALRGCGILPPRIYDAKELESFFEVALELLEKASFRVYFYDTGSAESEPEVMFVHP